MIEAMKLAFADVYAHVADARHMQVPPEQMLQADYRPRERGSSIRISPKPTARAIRPRAARFTSPPPIAAA